MLFDKFVSTGDHPAPVADGAEDLGDNGQLLRADCLTANGAFSEYIRELSPAGAMIQSDRPLEVGEEIAMTIALPNKRQPLRVTGEVFRRGPEGIGVKFKVIFNR